MATSAAPQLRQRTAFEIIDVSIQVFRRHYATFIMLVALQNTPSWIVLWLSGFMTMMSRITPTTNPASLFNFGAFAWFPVTALWAWIFGGAVVVAASDAYLEGIVDPGRALRLALTRAGSLILAGILLYVAFFLGVIALIVGVIYVYLRYFAVVPVLLLEDKSAVDSFHRSRDLSEGFKGRIFGTMCLAWIIFWVVAVAFQTLFAFVPMAPTARALVNAVVQLFAFPLVSIVLVVLYYDQRVRKDGFDLEYMARDIAPAAVQA